MSELSCIHLTRLALMRHFDQIVERYFGIALRVR